MKMYGHILMLTIVIHIITACDQQIDIVFIIDGSESVTSSSFIQQKAFVASQTLWYPISPLHVKLGLILFSSNVSDVIHLNPFKTDREFRRSVTQLIHPSHGSSIHLALRTLRRLFVDEGRKNAKKVGILITDGKSRRLWNTLKEARLLRLSDILMVSIGVGNRISERELRELTHDRGTYFRINTFEELFALSEKLRQLICPYTQKSTTRKMILKNSTQDISGLPVADGLALKSFFDPYEHIDSKTGPKDITSPAEVVVDSDTSEENITSDFATDVPTSLNTNEYMNSTKFVTAFITTRNVTNFTFPVVAYSNATTLAATTLIPHHISTTPTISSSIKTKHTEDSKSSNITKMKTKLTVNPTQKSISWDSLLSLLTALTGTSEVETSFVNPTIKSVKKEELMKDIPLPPPIVTPSDETSATTKPDITFSDVSFTTEKRKQNVNTSTTRTSEYSVTEGPLLKRDQVSNPKVSIRKSVPSITLFSLDFDVKEKRRSQDNLWRTASILNAKTSAVRPPRADLLSNSQQRDHITKHTQPVSKRKTFKKNVFGSQNFISRSIVRDKMFSKPSVSKVSSLSSVLSVKEKDVSAKNKKMFFRGGSVMKNKKRVRNKKARKKSKGRTKSSGIKPFKSPSIGLIDRILFSTRLKPTQFSSYAKRRMASRRSDKQFYRREVSFLPSSEYRKRIIRGKSEVVPSNMKMEPAVKSNNQICTNKPFSRDSRYYLEKVAGTKYEIRPCPDGTAYDARTCGCTIRTLVNGNRECRPELQLDFRKDFRDSSGKNTAVADSKVELKGGNAIFNSLSTISVWRFAGTYIGNNLMIKLLFKPQKSVITRQTLVGNCGKGRKMSYSIEIDRAEEVAIFTVDTIPRSPVSVKVPIKLNDWNDVTLIYDGLDLTGLNYERRRSKPLAGPIETRSTPLFIGGCSRNDGFVGEIDAIAIYFCSPQRKVLLG